MVARDGSLVVCRLWVILKAGQQAAGSCNHRTGTSCLFLAVGTLSLMLLCTNNVPSCNAGVTNLPVGITKLKNLICLVSLAYAAE